MFANCEPMLSFFKEWEYFTGLLVSESVFKRQVCSIISWTYSKVYLYLFLTTSVIINYVRAVSNGASCNSSWTFVIGCKTLTNLRAQMALKIYDGNFKGILDKKLKFPIYQTYS